MSRTPHKARLVEGPIGPTLTRLTIPMVFGLLSNVLFNAVDTFFVSRLDVGLAEPVHQAAMGFTYSPVVFFGMLAMGLSAGLASVVSRAIGAGDHHRVQRLTTHGLLLILLITGVLIVVGMLTIRPLFRMLGAADSLLPMISEYMLVWYAGMLFLMFPFVANNAIRAAGDTVWPMIIMLIGTAVNVVLDPLLIFGLLGFPAMGLTGAALATVIARALTAVASLAVLHYGKRMVEFARPTWAQLREYWGAILYAGVPAAVTNLLWPISLGVAMRLIAIYGDAAVAGVGAGMRIEGFAMLVLWSLGSTLGPFVGQNWGARLFDRVHHAQTLVNRFAVLWGLAMWGLLVIFAEPIAHIFNHDPTTVEATKLFLFIAPAGYGLRGVCFLANRSLNAINRPLDAGLVDSARMFLFYLPLTILGQRILGLGGVVAGLVVGNILGGIVATLWYAHTERRLEAARRQENGETKPG